MKRTALRRVTLFSTLVVGIFSGCSEDLRVDDFWPDPSTGAARPGDRYLEGFDPGLEQSVCGGELHYVLGAPPADTTYPPVDYPLSRDTVAEYSAATGSLHWDVLRDDGSRGLSERRFCTGTLIDDDLLLTAGHCLDDNLEREVRVMGDECEPGRRCGARLPESVRDAANAARAASPPEDPLRAAAEAICPLIHIDFRHELLSGPPAADADGHRSHDPAAYRRFDGHFGHAFRCAEVLALEYFERDFAIIRLAPADLPGRGLTLPGEIYPPRPIRLLEPDEPLVEDTVVVFQHPIGAPMRMSSGRMWTDRNDDDLLMYDAPTDVGSSGAGVLDGRGRLIGVHNDGTCTDDNEPTNWATAIHWLADVPSIRTLLDTPCRDLDGDGILGGPNCAPPCDGAVCPAFDCNDRRATTSPAAIELCNTVDDDCDGLIDEGFVGRVEDCNGLDDDCDGSIDEGVVAELANQQDCVRRGGCNALACVDGAWLCEAVEASVEEECPRRRAQCGYGSTDEPTCTDGLDNDCDGAVDEYDPSDRCMAVLWQAIATSGPWCTFSPHGACAEELGHWECVDGGELCDPQAQCVDAPGPRDEDCSGRDLDCDGVTDERGDLDGDGFGDCPGRMDCAPMDPSRHPEAFEVFDDEDDDCDGRIDEGVVRANVQPDGVYTMIEGPMGLTVSCPRGWLATDVQVLAVDILFFEQILDIRLGCRPRVLYFDPADPAPARARVRPNSARIAWSHFASGMNEPPPNASGFRLSCPDSWLVGLRRVGARLEPICDDVTLFGRRQNPHRREREDGCMEDRVISGLRGSALLQGLEFTCHRIVADGF